MDFKERYLSSFRPVILEQDVASSFEGCHDMQGD